MVIKEEYEEKTGFLQCFISTVSIWEALCKSRHAIQSVFVSMVRGLIFLSEIIIPDFLLCMPVSYWLSILAAGRYKPATFLKMRLEIEIYLSFIYNGSKWNSFKNKKGITKYYALIFRDKQQSHSFQINILDIIIVPL